MGSVLTCCCPESEEDGPGGVGGDPGDAYGPGFTSDVAPLMRDGSWGGGQGHQIDPDDSLGESGDGFGSYDGRLVAAAAPVANAANGGVSAAHAKMQHRLNEILQVPLCTFRST